MWIFYSFSHISRHLRTLMYINGRPILLPSCYRHLFFHYISLQNYAYKPAAALIDNALQSFLQFTLRILGHFLYFRLYLKLQLSRHHLLSHRFCRSGIWVWLSQVLYFRITPKLQSRYQISFQFTLRPQQLVLG